MHPKSPEFKKLQALWDAKLKESGFEDAEQRDGNLRRWHSHDFIKKLSSLKFQVQEEYYKHTNEFLNSHVFESPEERKVWELHSEGVPIREIAKVINHSKVRTKWKVHKIIQSLEKLMVASWKA